MNIEVCPHYSIAPVCVAQLPVQNAVNKSQEVTSCAHKYILHTKPSYFFAKEIFTFWVFVSNYVAT